MLRYALLSLFALASTLCFAAPAAAAEEATQWVPHFVGDGTIEDFRTGETIQIPMEDRVHVALFAEGYTRKDIDAGRFDRDVERWMNEVFAVEPYATFRQAMVVWKLPEPSAERIAPGVSDTALRLPVRKDGRGVDLQIRHDGETAARVWERLHRLPAQPAGFFPQGGRTSGMARNVVAHVMALDPRTGRTGLSGVAMLFDDPAKKGQRVATAIGHDLAHEFSHAFSRLADEYINGPRGVDNHAAGTSSAMLSNVVKEPRCDSLPWRHLLPGTAINPHTQDLVGAFGFENLGFRPEFTCLMNGQHHNAQHYGGDGWLRTPERLCNFCREVTAFRFLERTGVLADPGTSLATWEKEWRDAFFTRYGFDAPQVLPQRNSKGQGWYQGCT